MNRARAIGLGVAFTIAARHCMAQGADAAALPVTAAHTTDSAEVCFDVNHGVDWKAVAVGAIGRLATDSPDSETFKTYFVDAFSTVEIPFTARASPAIRDQNWLVFFPDRTETVHPTMYRGTVEWVMDPRTKRLETGPHHGGQGCTPPASGRQHSLWAIRGDSSANWTSSRGPTARFAGSDDRERRYTTVIAGAEYSFRTQTHSTIRATRLFHSRGRTFLVVLVNLYDCIDMAYLYDVRPGTTALKRIAERGDCGE